ncbi:MAG: hypothetical protein WA987_11360 [Cellvibrio sp.]
MNADEIKKNGLIESRLFKFLENDNEVVEIDPNDLLTPNRFDVAIKLSYLRHKNIAPKFSRKIYCDHLMAFGGGKINEPEKPEKNSLNKFLSEFQITVGSIEKEGFNTRQSIIPLARDGSILNGAHRVASAIYLGRTVKAIKLDADPSDYSYEFFLKRYTPWYTLLAGLQEFMQRRSNVRVALYWPKANNLIDYRPKNIIAEYTTQLKFKDFAGFVRQVYRAEPWLGDPGNDYHGALHKARNCYLDGVPLKVVVFLAQPDEDLVSIKASIRSELNIGKHALHISDHAQDTQQVVNFIFNENSRRFLSLEDSSRFPKKDKRIKKVFDAISEVKADPYKVAVDSGCVLEVYGLREAYDIDTISVENEKNIERMKEFGISNHNDAFSKCGIEFNEVICDPSYHFWYGGVKFVSLEVLLSFKKIRGEEKDLKDIRLVDALISQSKWGLKKALIKQRVFYFKYSFYRRCKHFIVGVLKALRIFDFVKKLLGR